MHLERQGSGKYKYPVVSCLFCIRFESSLTKEIHPSASASGLFPLWLRRPRFLCAAFSLLSALRGGSFGAAPSLGEGRVLPPARVHPRSFGFHPRTTPFLHCIREFCSVASATKEECLRCSSAFVL